MSKSWDNVSNPFIVVKFGGSSLADGSKISNAVNMIVKELQKGSKIVAVVSALGKTTDFLLDIAKEFIDNDCQALKSDLDDILAMGERTSARLFSAALKANGIKCRYFDPACSDWPIITNDKPTNADPILIECEKRTIEHVLPMLHEGIVVVLPGFIGRTLDGKITTMGRGGSDVTALVVARILKAKKVILVSDVDGIMTADPRLVNSAKRIPEIKVKSLIGLTSPGNKFLQRKALKYLDETLEVKIISYRHGDLDVDGTVIKGSLAGEAVSLEYPESVASITVVGDSLLDSPETLREILQKIRIEGCTLLGVSANTDSLIVYAQESMLEKILDSIHSIILNDNKALAMAVRKNLALIRIKTAELEETPGIISRAAQALYAKNINIYGLFTVASGIHIFVDKNSVKEALGAVKSSVEVVL